MSRKVARAIAAATLGITVLAAGSAAAVPVLAHRLMLRPEHWGGRVSTPGIVRSLLDRIPTPAVEMS